jgi:uracil-DNA glycosylase
MAPLDLNGLADHEYIAKDWVDALSPVGSQLAKMGDFLRSEDAAGVRVLPAGNNILRAFQTPLSQVRVLIVGQDPYPTPGHPVGLSFSVNRDVRPIPRSLQNIYRELQDDLGLAPAPHGDLTSWAQHGVMLLNRVLTVRAGAAASHRGKGWEQFTEQAIHALAARDQPLVAILWGNDAKTLKPWLPKAHIIESVHPSPLSASRGFFGSKPFSRANHALEAMGAEPVDWQVR